jgi:hypothetical protein
MNKENRKNLLVKIVAALDEMTSGEMSNRQSVTIGGHKIARRLLYAGGSQWTGCGRDWERIECGWAWVADGEYMVTVPGLFGWDGHNMVARQTPYYLLDGYDEQATPEHDGRSPLDRVPNPILLQIAKGLAAAQASAKAAAQAEDTEAAQLLSAL